ncbi:MAG: cell division protein ZapA [Chitinophagaceae bacterium]
MDKVNQIPVQAIIGTRTYKILVAPDEEENVRLKLKEIQSIYNNTKKQFPNRDEQDYLSMTILHFVTQLNELLPSTTSDKQDLSEIQEKLQTLKTILSR